MNEKNILYHFLQIIFYAIALVLILFIEKYWETRYNAYRKIYKEILKVKKEKNSKKHPTPIDRWGGGLCDIIKV